MTGRYNTEDRRDRLIAVVGWGSQSAAGQRGIDTVVKTASLGTIRDHVFHFPPRKQRVNINIRGPAYYVHGTDCPQVANSPIPPPISKGSHLLQPLSSVRVVRIFSGGTSVVWGQSARQLLREGIVNSKSMPRGVDLQTRMY